VGDVKVLRSHVERCLQDIWELCRVTTDSDGDYPFAHGTACCYVRVEDGDPQVVRVYAHAVIGVRRSAKLLTEINDLNGRCRTASVSWSSGVVIVEQALHAKAVRRSTLRQACQAVGYVADDIGTMIATVYGGETPLGADDAQLSEEAS
jgi:hypothetical protein